MIRGSVIRARLKRKAPPAKNAHCQFCGCTMVWRNAPGAVQRFAATADHILPKSRGGGHGAENLRWCCKNCNGALGHLGGCAGALACAFAVVGRRAAVRDVARWWNRNGVPA